MTLHYLDYNATAPVMPEIIARMAEVMASPNNASSVHDAGRAARALLDTAREQIAAAVNCWPNEVVFTASGTESNNLALRGFPDRKLLVSAIEHPSILRVCPEAIRIPVTRDGVVDIHALDRLLAEHSPALVSVMLANNETGAIQPIAEIAALARRYHALVHTDAVQAFGRVPVDFSQLGVDLMTITAHKLGGPQGAAALILRNDLPLRPLIAGGHQELGRRPGTENIAAIVGFAMAASSQDVPANCKDMRARTQRFEQALLEISPDAVIACAADIRIPNTTCITLPGVSSETMLMSMDLAGVAVSAGSACSSGRMEPSHVLLAMGYSEEAVGQTIRVSTGWNTTEDDIEAFLQVWAHLAQKRVNRNAA